MIKIIVDTLTPALSKAEKDLHKEPYKLLQRTLKFGKQRAKYYVRSKGKATRTGDLEKGIFYRSFKKNLTGYVASVASGKRTGFPYNKWVNKEIRIRGSYPYFNTKTLIQYGQGGVKSPSGKPILWSANTKIGFFNQAMLDMKRYFDKHWKNIKMFKK